MKTLFCTRRTKLFFNAVIFTALWLQGLRPVEAAPVVAKPQVNEAVTIMDNGRDWVLGNGIVRATINKNNGTMS